MTCSQVRELAAAYSLDALTRHERQRVDRHLDRCPRCRREVAGLAEAAAGLARLVAPVEPPPGLRTRVIEQARQMGRQVASPAPASRPHPPRASPKHPSRLGRALAYAGVAVLLFAAGWAAGRVGPGPGFGGSVFARRQVVAARIQQELWQAIAGPGLSVRPLEVDPGMQEAVAFVALAGDPGGCRLRVVAEGVPAPPRGFGYEAWVWVRGGSVERIGLMQATGPGRFELAARVAAPTGDLETLQVWLAPVAPVPPAGGGDGAPAPGQPRGHKVIWGKLWAPEDEGSPAGRTAW